MRSIKSNIDEIKLHFDKNTQPTIKIQLKH